MPHVVILYTPNLEARTDMSALCRRLADALLAVRNEEGQQVFPTPGTRVLAYPAAHCAVADGKGDYGFIYLNLRMGRGRSVEVQKLAGRTLEAAALEHLQPLMATLPVGVTLQVDVGAEAFDSKNSSLRPLFNQ
jgi:5-carboxymethyl-2-hydroxymuconate isomerase